MKRSVLIGVLTLATGPLLAAESDLKGDIVAAAAKLAEQPNYSWTATVKVPEGTMFRPGPIEGKTEKDGVTYLAMSFRDNTTHAVVKGDKRAITNRDGEWQSMADLESGEGPGRWLAGTLRSIMTPAQQAEELAAAAAELTHEGDAYSGDLTEDGAVSFVSFRRSREGDGPTVRDAKGSVTFWLQDGALTKYEFSVSGNISFNDNDFDVDRTTTVVIKDVGATTIEVPEEANEKLM